MASEPLRIGLFGGGVVGGGVYTILEERKQQSFQALGAHAQIVKVCVRDLSKPRSFTASAHTELVTDYDAILEDDSINCVIELMGGVTHAKDVVFKAIAKGKHVITANKALLAQYLPEVQQLLAANPKVKLGYEAAVCGGIPIINALQQDYLGDDITKVMGIMNGTTNFMLTKMEQEGADYAVVLKEAQDLGFAEADPTADVEGHDVQAKIALLAKLAFGATVPVQSVPCTGISSLTASDFAFAKSMGCTIKLVGTALLLEPQPAAAAATTAAAAAAPSIAVFVSPVLAPLAHPLATARGAGNMVVVSSANCDQSVFAGPGAGRFPTANSVISDVLRLARGLCSPAFPLEAQCTLESDFSARFYVRAAAAERGAHVLAELGTLAQAAAVEVVSLQWGQGSAASEFVVTTAQCKHSQIKQLCAELSSAAWTQGSHVFMSLL